MSDSSMIVERYLAVWNETDPERRLDLIAQSWADDARYIDPLMQGAGHAQIGQLVGGVHAQFPGQRFVQRGAVDVHHGYIRFSWDLAPEGGPATVGGTDVALVGQDGRLQHVTGFIDYVAAAPEV